MKNSVYTIFYLAIVVLFYSCDPLPASSYYIPRTTQMQNIFYTSTMPNVSFTKRAGDLSSSLSIVSAKNQTGGNIQGVYMPFKKADLRASYFTSSGNNINHQNIELGSGYHFFVDSAKQYNLYGGFGIGSLHNIHATGSSTINNNYFFLQPALCFVNKNETQEIGIVSKFVFNKFKVRDTLFNTSREDYNLSQMNILFEHPNQIFWEPSIVYKIGVKNFKFHLGYSHIINLSQKELNYSKYSGYFGCSISLNTKKGK